MFDIIMFILLCIAIGYASERIYNLLGFHYIKCKGCSTKIRIRARHISESELANIYSYTIIGNKYYCPTCINVQVRRKIIEAGI